MVCATNFSNPIHSPDHYLFIIVLTQQHAGLLVFHVKDMLTPLLLIVTFEAPGMYFIGLLSMLAMYFFDDLGSYQKHYSPRIKIMTDILVIVGNTD